MVRNRIDRYVSRSFLMFFVGIVLLIYSLYVSFDLVKEVEDLQESGLQNVLPTILSYYLNLFPVFILNTIPTAILIAAGLTVIRMVNNRELMVLNSAGISVYRVLLPILLWTLVISAGLFWMRESVVPGAARRKALLEQRLEGGVQHRLLVEDEEQDFLLFADEYRRGDQTLHRVSILQVRPEGTLRVMIEADSAASQEGDALVLKGVHVRLFDKTGTEVQDPQKVANLLEQSALEPFSLQAGHLEDTTLPLTPTKLEVETSLEPFDFVEATRDQMGESAMHLTLGELQQRMQDRPNVPHFAVLFHQRLSSSLSPFLLLLVGLPFLVGFERSGSGRVMGIVVCILVAAAYYTVVFVSVSMGNTGTLPAVVAGWLPTIVSAPCGGVLFSTMLT